MTKIEELLRSHYSNREVEGLEHQFQLLEMVAHEYAEWYALEYRSKILDNCWTDDYCQTLISDIELLKIEFPTHE